MSKKSKSKQAEPKQAEQESEPKQAKAPVKPEPVVFTDGVHKGRELRVYGDSAKVGGAVFNNLKKHHYSWSGDSLSVFDSTTGALSAAQKKELDKTFPTNRAWISPNGATSGIAGCSDC